MSERDPQVGRRRLLGVAGAGLAGLAGYSRETGAAGSSRVRLGTLYPPVTLDPITAAALGSEPAVRKVVDGLYAYGEGFDTVPRIADGPPRRPDGTTVEVDVRSRRALPERPSGDRGGRGLLVRGTRREGAPTKWRVGPAESAETVSEPTVRYHLRDPYPALDHRLTHPVVPKPEREESPERFGRDPVGSGPFAVRSSSEERRVVLDRWDGYWGASPRRSGGSRTSPSRTPSRGCWGW